MTPAELHEAAVRTLTSNWTGTATQPSPRQYPHQWSWDSAFIAIGLAHVNPERAKRELLSLFTAQWRPGRLPHILFSDGEGDSDYFPGPGFWRTGQVRDAPPLATSGIVQPPVHARAAMTVFRRAAGSSDAVAFLHRLYPKLAAQHRYLFTHREVSGEGLVAIVHPWESGMDNSPAWDPFLAEVTRPSAVPVARRDTVHVPPDERPTDDDYHHYLALAESYRDLGYDDRRLAAEHPFLVEDPLFNAVLLDGELCLAEMAPLLGLDPAPHLAGARRIHSGLLERLWDEALGTFLARDARTGRRARVPTVAGFVPLLDPWLPKPVVDRLVSLLVSPAFAGGCEHPVPSSSLLDDSFDRRRYWRGPTWINTNWLVSVGARRAGREEVAELVRQSSLTLVGKAGFREYFDPVDGRGLGAHDFSWSAALTLDMLAGRTRADLGAPILPTASS